MIANNHFAYPLRDLLTIFTSDFVTHVNNDQITVVGSFPKKETNDLKCNTAEFPIHQ